MTLVQKAQKVVDFVNAILDICEENGFENPSSEAISKYINEGKEMDAQKFIEEYYGFDFDGDMGLDELIDSMFADEMMKLVLKDTLRCEKAVLIAICNKAAVRHPNTKVFNVFSTDENELVAMGFALLENLPQGMALAASGVHNLVKEIGKDGMAAFDENHIIDHWVDIYSDMIQNPQDYADIKTSDGHYYLAEVVFPIVMSFAADGIVS